MSEIPPEQFAAYPRGSSDPREYYGPPDFRINAINEAWLLYKSDMVTWILGYVVILLIIIMVHSPAQLYTFIKVTTEGPRAVSSLDVTAITFISSLISAVVGGLLHAGFYRVALQRMRLIPEGIGGFFNLRGQGLVLAAWSLLYSLPTIVVSSIYNATAPQPDRSQPMPDLMQLFGPMLLYFGALLLISLLLFPFFLTPLIIVDQKLGLMEAAGKSWKVVTRMYLKALAFYIVASLVGVIGVVGCGIGVVFTIPLLYLAIAVVYRDHFIPPLTEKPATYP